MANNIKYTSRDFKQIQTDLKNYLAQQFPDYGNFTEQSSSKILLDAVAWVGDIVNFYQDQSFKELFLDTAKDPKNIIQLAKTLGYKYTGKKGSIVDVNFYITVPFINNNGRIEPDTRFYLTIRSGTIIKSNTTPLQYFQTIQNCNFNDYDDIQIAERVDDEDPDSAPTKYALTKKVKCITGQTKIEIINVGDYTPFLEIELGEKDVLSIVSLTDTSNNVYYEVDYLAQDQNFTITENSATGELDQVPYIVNLQNIPYRFERHVDENGLSKLVFGTGSQSTDDDTLVPNPYQYIMSGTAYQGNVIDVNNFLGTRTLGITPTNTALAITYLHGGGVLSNVPANSIVTVHELLYDWPTNDVLADKAVVLSSLECNNILPAQGGKDAPTTNEIKYYASANFLSQKRAVTLTDYISLIYTMPEQFGVIYRAYAEASTGSDNSINVFVLSQNDFGELTFAYDTLKENLKLYLSKYRMLNDTLYIQDGNILNIQIKFNIVISNQFNKPQVLFECINAIKDKYKNSNMDFNRPIIIGEIHNIIYDIPGVISLSDLKIINVVGTISGKTYSEIEWNIDNNTKSGILYSSPKHIFEIKYPDSDIIGQII